MAIRLLERPQRQAYFERVSRHLGATRVGVEIDGLDIGAQREFDDLNLTGLTYDPRSDEVEIFTDDIDHHIAHPREVYVDDGADGLHSVEIVDGEGHKQIIRLKSPLALPRDASPGPI
ncbi:hypothetical protein CAI21_05550 [Alkalilimnicola ehrlichii]|uniref:Uncharacterized protein n=1 Tax=Alkalilimnicola ehrlichii TaxID=351052 RepID=A0A3E0X0W0_9GAMM|nr:DUF5335 family protein [Alkalilimnicola ehrlichii]RFA30512.1 hypothetical protein CAI21_05550 [Alkalilimnicola ehrlichii]RFA38061.1 hypothetical protein CAL65_06920 [Alkalilimnicola ehrlichii]